MGRSALHPRFQCTASALAVHCVQNNLRRTCKDGCTYLQGQMLNEGFSRKRLRERLQCFASERGKTGAEIVSPILDERKDGSIRVTIAPRKILLSAEESVSHVVMSSGGITEKPLLLVRYRKKLRTNILIFSAKSLQNENKVVHLP